MPIVSSAERTALVTVFQLSFSDCGRAPEKRRSRRLTTSRLLPASSLRGTKTSFAPQGALTALSVKIFVSMSLG